MKRMSKSAVMGGSVLAFCIITAQAFSMEGERQFYDVLSDGFNGVQPRIVQAQMDKEKDEAQPNACDDFKILSQRKFIFRTKGDSPIKIDQEFTFDNCDRGAGDATGGIDPDYFAYFDAYRLWYNGKSPEYFLFIWYKPNTGYQLIVGYYSRDHKDDAFYADLGFYPSIGAILSKSLYFPKLEISHPSEHDGKDVTVEATLSND